ncbi:DEAD/DEAH box helicase [Candidatus Nomurabacteria bacterium]|nr:DEAD/DEAH box helicase [Candidatus Nomurabacteria bacterium]
MFTIKDIQKEFDPLLSSQARIALLTGFPDHLDLYTVRSLASDLQKRVQILFFDDIESFESYSEGLYSNKVKAYLLEVGGALSEIDLVKQGLSRVNRVWKPGEFSIYGDVAVIWPIGFVDPVRVSMFGDEIENISIVDAETRRRIEEISKIEISHGGYDTDDLVVDTIIEGVQYTENFPLMLAKVRGVNKFHGEDISAPVIDIGFRALPLVGENVLASSILETLIKTYTTKGYSIQAIDTSRDRYDSASGYVKNMSEFKKVVGDTLAIIPKGFIDEREKTVILTPYETFGELDLSDHYHTGESVHEGTVASIQKVQREEIFKKIVPGDHIVHDDHGVGQYNGVIEREEGVFIEVRYAGKDRLYVPLTQSKKLTKYIGSGKDPVLTSLNSGSWRRIRKKAEADAEKLAMELIQLYAMRKLMKTEQNEVKQSDFQNFIDRFEYQDTEDQIVATEEIIRDMRSGSPMDRLLVGDVGFGKTEVAMRAMYWATLQKKQVVMLAPTTVLVEQHRAVIEDRFEGTGVKISAVSRFLPPTKQREAIESAKNGEVDILIGTHSLLNPSIKFKNIGLIVIDEEQKFGVSQKESLKQKRVESHVLSLSATPIPRTLNMSLSGIRDISVIATPPHRRRAIKNMFAKFDWSLVNRAISKELERKGQVYYLHNRVKDIIDVKNKLQKYFPGSVVEIAHGQLSDHELSEVMYRFGKGHIDILVCTTIIENGLDLPNVNTLVVDRSEIFGLSQLYQIRGRIGRSDKQAYAYFFHTKLVGQAGDRLEALEEAESLGSGFLLANRDMEIRGVGELLGREQSGAISSVGYGLYMTLLQEKVLELKEGVEPTL